MDPIQLITFLKEILPDEIQKKLIEPTANSLGNTLGDAVEVMSAPVSIPLKYLSGYVKDIKSKIDYKFSTYSKSEIEYENIDLNKILKYSNDLSYSLDSEEIRNIFANLITKSFIKNDKYSLHPAFSAIVSELSPLDARNLAIIYETYPKESFAIVDYKAVSPNGSFNILKYNVFLENTSETNLDVQSLSIENLERLKLVKIEEKFKWDQSTYDKFMATSFYLETEHGYKKMKESWDSAGYPKEEIETWVSELTLVKKTCELSSFGKLFCEICFN